MQGQSLLVRNFYSSVTPRPSRREPRDRSTLKLHNKVHEKACSSTASASSSTSTSSLSLENARASDLGTCSEHDYSVSSNMLYQNIVDLRAVSTEKVSEKNWSSSKPGPKRKLTLLDEFVSVLMRLKVGLFLNDLADRYGISMAQSSKIFTAWINFLHHALQLLFPFPSRAKIDKLMPSEFA